MKIFIAAVSLICLSSSASANDSSAAVGIGGLELRQNSAISMDSEDLFISRQRITVKYRFTNTSTKDIETLVSFPLPPLPGGIEGYLGDQSIPNWRDDLHFKTFVDGKPVKLAIHEVVSVIGDPDSKDISAQLKSLGWPVSYWTDYPFEEKLQKLPSDKKKQLLMQGLLRTEDDADYVIPNWQVTTHVTRTQRFPAGKTISVEHIYKPVAGGSVGGVLIAEYRKNSAEYFEEYAKRYCIDTAFLKAFDKAYAVRQGAAKANGDEYAGVPFTEHWISYVLKSGANWKGPIKNFRLIVDKEKPANFLSFCGEDLKKITPTRFELQKTNFEPTANLDILIVEFFNPEKN